MNRVKRYGNYLVWSMIVLYVVFLVRCVPAKWWFKRVYRKYNNQYRSFIQQQIIIKKANIYITHLERMINLSCLERSLSLQTILKKEGVYCQIQFGVRKELGFSYHAWLEYEIANNNTFKLFY